MMAVERVRDGERASSVVASFGFHRTTIAAIKRCLGWSGHSSTRQVSPILPTGE